MIRTRKGLKDLPFSELRAIVQKTKEIEKTEGVKVVKFIIGSPDFDVPSNIKIAVKKSLDSIKDYVPSNYGFDDLRKLIVEKVESKNNIKININNVLVTVGSGEAITLSIFSTLNKGDEVLISDPAWPYYEYIAKIFGIVPVFYPLRYENNFNPDPAELEKSISKKTRVLIINSPNNPTGSVFNKEILKDLSVIASKYDLTVISDEAYEDIVYDSSEHVSIASLKDMFERTITTFTFSKSYAMLPWRIGYAVAPAEIIETMVKIHQHTLINVDTLSQYGAISALGDEKSKKALNKMVKEYEIRRNTVVKHLYDCKYLFFKIPKGTFYIFPKVDSSLKINDVNYANYLLKEARVAVSPGSAFGPIYGKNHFRLSFTVNMEDINKGMDRIKNSMIKI